MILQWSLFSRNLERKQQYSNHTIQELYKKSSEELSLELILELLRHISRQPMGAVLVFLPGWDNISKLHNMIKDDTMLSSRKATLYFLLRSDFIYYMIWCPMYWLWIKNHTLNSSFLHYLKASVPWILITNTTHCKK